MFEGVHYRVEGLRSGPTSGNCSILGTGSNLAAVMVSLSDHSSTRRQDANFERILDSHGKRTPPRGRPGHPRGILISRKTTSSSGGRGGGAHAQPELGGETLRECAAIPSTASPPGSPQQRGTALDMGLLRLFGSCCSSVANKRPALSLIVSCAFGSVIMELSIVAFGGPQEPRA